MAIQGCLYGEDRPFAERELDREKENFRTFFRKTMKRFRLSKRGKMTRDLSKLNIIAWWYTHNMFVHYRVPRGLEQYGGAAWNAGCLPGPAEYMLATQKACLLRKWSRVSSVFSRPAKWSTCSIRKKKRRGFRIRLIPMTGGSSAKIYQGGGGSPRKGDPRTSFLPRRRPADEPAREI
ncbi:hypothetical protein [Caldibacillus debilis]|uniref:hypothetical protein n=1 Tax=Caldibacillus debilis TaxID=301148 RepID=UPI0012B5D32C|nr:hypothetical protein [Caldibacillus debilis]